MSKYAGHLMTTGAQAQTFADHFIAVPSYCPPGNGHDHRSDLGAGA